MILAGDIGGTKTALALLERGPASGRVVREAVVPSRDFDTLESAIAQFLAELYPDGATIEHTVITHHDEDHVAGFTNLLRAGDLRFEHVYHNGLVSYRSGALPRDDGVSLVRDGARDMARVILDGGRRVLHPDDLLDSLGELESLLESGLLQGPAAVYRRLADALLHAKAEGRFVRQTGGRGQFGHVVLEVEPTDPGAGFVFENKIVGGAIPREYIPAVENGIREAMDNGVVAGFPMIDVRARLVDGSFHEVDSSEMAFKIAGSMGFRAASQKASPALKEPVMAVEVVTPE